MDPDSEGPTLPRHTGDDSKPSFTPRVGEFKFWKLSMEGTAVASVMTFFSVFNVLVYWPILVLYFILLLVITMQKKIAHMIKHKCVRARQPHLLLLTLPTLPRSLPCTHSHAHIRPTPCQVHSVLVQDQAAVQRQGRQGQGRRRGQQRQQQRRHVCWQQRKMSAGGWVVCVCFLLVQGEGGGGIGGRGGVDACVACPSLTSLAPRGGGVRCAEVGPRGRACAAPSPC